MGVVWFRKKIDETSIFELSLVPPVRRRRRIWPFVIVINNFAKIIMCMLNDISYIIFDTCLLFVMTHAHHCPPIRQIKFTSDQNLPKFVPPATHVHVLYMIAFTFLFPFVYSLPFSSSFFLSPPLFLSLVVITILQWSSWTRPCWL